MECDTCDVERTPKTTTAKLGYTEQNNGLRATMDTPDPVIRHKLC